jgi:hypothetical protein
MVMPDNDEDVEQWELSYIATGNIKPYNLLKNSLTVLINIHLPHDPPVPLVGIS